MYGAVRERARTSTQITGLSVAILTTALVGYALANGFVVNIARIIDTTITFTPLVEKVVPDEPDKREANTLDTSIDRLVIPTPLPPTDTFEVDKEVIIGTTETGPRPGPVASAGNAVIPKPARIRPVLIKDDPPPYPPSEIRKKNEGDTALEVCIAANGRVTSASISASSGHPVLDTAALKWVRDARFTPGKLDGVAQAVCGHGVTYEWNLADVRK
jgi:TonB family protein